MRYNESRDPFVDVLAFTCRATFWIGLAFCVGFTIHALSTFA